MIAMEKLIKQNQIHAHEQSEYEEDVIEELMDTIDWDGKMDANDEADREKLGPNPLKDHGKNPL